MLVPTASGRAVLYRPPVAAIHHWQCERHIRIAQTRAEFVDAGRGYDDELAWWAEKAISGAQLLT